MRRFSAVIRTTRRLLPVLALALLVSGCTSWSQAYPGSLSSPADVIDAHSPEDVRILRQRGVEIQLHKPVVSGDSIVGEARRFGFGRVAIPLSDIRRLDVPEGDGIRSAGLIIVAFPFALLAYVMLTCLFAETCS